MRLIRLIQTGAIFTLRVLAQADLPSIKSNFAKGVVHAQWVPGHPIAWGSEDFHYNLGIKNPSQDDFDATVTHDEKYLVMLIKTQVQFTDIENNATAAIVSLSIPQTYTHLYASGLKIRRSTQGRYDVLFTLFEDPGISKVANPVATGWQRVGAGLQPMGSTRVIEGGIGAISSQGRLALLSGEIYDLKTTSSTPITNLHLDSGRMAAMMRLEFAPDGVQVVSGTWAENNANIWNTTSGEKLLRLPQGPKPGVILSVGFSSDGSYLAVAYSGYSSDSVKIYTLAQPEVAPIEIALDYGGSLSNIAWSLTGQQLAIGESGRLRIFDVPSMEVTQTWAVEGVDEYHPNYVANIEWLDDGKKITWMWNYGRYLYDFEANKEWLWTVRRTDRVWGAPSFHMLKDRGYFVTVDGDATVRFWKD